MSGDGEKVEFEEPPAAGMQKEDDMEETDAFLKAEGSVDGIQQIAPIQRPTPIPAAIIIREFLPS
jgi:hypothetical protein